MLILYLHRFSCTISLITGYLNLHHISQNLLLDPFHFFIYRKIRLYFSANNHHFSFIDTSDLPKPPEQIPIWIPFLKTTPARISCAISFNSYWNIRFTSQIWTEALYIKNCDGQGYIYMMSNTRSVAEFAISFWSEIAPLELVTATEEEITTTGGNNNRSRRKQQQ